MNHETATYTPEARVSHLSMKTNQPAGHLYLLSPITTFECESAQHFSVFNLGLAFDSVKKFAVHFVLTHRHIMFQYHDFKYKISNAAAGGSSYHCN